MQQHDSNKKLGFVLLIDDDHEDTEFHESIILSSGLAQTVKTIYHPLEAITYFKYCLTEPPGVETKQYPVPDLILLDLRMPVYNGFEVLQHFQEMEDPYGRKASIKFVLLPGLLHAFDLEKCLNFPDLIIAAFTKPLTPAYLKEIAEKHF